MASKTKKTPDLNVTNHKRRGKKKETTAQVAAAPTEAPKEDETPADPPAATQLAHAAAEKAEQEAKKRKIEKDREERNGVKRPSAGGLCREVWDFCDAQHTADSVPTVKSVKLEAEARGWNSNNASIEYYNWRKFMGIRGRQAVQNPQQHSPEPDAN